MMIYASKKGCFLGCFALSAITMLSACEFKAGAGAGRDPQTAAQNGAPTPAAPTAPAAPATPAAPGRTVTYHPEQGAGAAPAVSSAPVPATAPGPVKQISINGTGMSLPTATADTGFGGGTESPDALRGVVYFIPEGTQKFPDVSALKPSGVLFAKQLNIPTHDFKEGFPGIDNRFEWFAIRYEGTFSVAKADSYAFRILSDDGSIVTIDDVKQLDNDGAHSTRGFAKAVPLTAGAHKIRVDYFQGPRFSVALQLWVSSASMKEKLWTAAF